MGHPEDQLGQGDRDAVGDRGEQLVVASPVTVARVVEHQRGVGAVPADQPRRRSSRQPASSGAGGGAEQRQRAGAARPGVEPGVRDGGVDGVLGHPAVGRAACRRRRSPRRWREVSTACRRDRSAVRPSASSSGRSPAKAPTTSARASGRASAADDARAGSRSRPRLGSGTSGTVAVDGLVGEADVDQAVGLGQRRRRSGWRSPGTGSVRRDRAARAASPRAARGGCRGSGAGATSSTRSPAQTPAALTTARARTSAVAAGQLVAQHGTCARWQLDGAGAGADLGAVGGGGARDRGDQPGVVLELAVPDEDAAAQPARAAGPGASASASVAEIRRGRGSVSREVRAAARAAGRRRRAPARRQRRPATAGDRRRAAAASAARGSGGGR